MTISVVNQRQKLFFESLVTLCKQYDVTITLGTSGRGWGENPNISYEFNWNERFQDECNTPDVIDSYLTGDDEVKLKGQ